MKLFAAITRLLAAGTLIAIGSAAAQQAYPSKPIRLISPFAPGGGNNIMLLVTGDPLRPIGYAFGQNGQLGFPVAKKIITDPSQHR